MSALQNTPLSPLRRPHELTRSASEVQTSTMSKSHHHHHLHHPHLPGHRRRDHSVSPGLHPGSTSADHIYDPKSDALTPYNSRRGSRRPSIWGKEDLDGNFDVQTMEKPQIKPGQIKREREKSALRASELRESLVELNTISNNTTRLLDNTYYSVLEKHSALQSTIASMQELAFVARNLDQDFKNETNEIVSEIDNQLKGFRNFTVQRQVIEAYAARIKAGREKVNSLCDRLKTVEAKVEKWEKSEGEWEQRTRRRLRILWTVMITCVLLFVALMVFQYLPVVNHGARGARDDQRVENTLNQTAVKMFKDELGKEDRSRMYDEL